MLENILPPHADVGLLILRLAVGIIFIYHGYPKMPFANSPMGGPKGFGGFLGQMGIPLPGLMAWVVALVEFVGGILLIAGFATHTVALLMAVIMIVAIWKAKIGMMKVGFMAQQATGWEFDFAVLGAALALFFTGPGQLALDFGLGL